MDFRELQALMQGRHPSQDEPLPSEYPRWNLPHAAATAADLLVGVPATTGGFAGGWGGPFPGVLGSMVPGAGRSLRQGVKAAGSAFSGVKANFGRLLEIMASKKAPRGSPLWDDLIQEGWATVTEVSPTLAAIPDDAKRQAKLAAAVRGAMIRYAGENTSNVRTPEAVRQARSQVRRAEARLKQVAMEQQKKAGAAFTTPRITDRAIASLTGRPLREVSRLRADIAQSGEVRIDEPEVGRILSAKIATRNPTEIPGAELPPAPPELPVAKIATTPNQERILALYRSGASVREAAKELSVAPSLVGRLYQKFRREGPLGSTKPPISGGSDVDAGWQAWYRGLMEDYKSGLANVPPPKRPMSSSEESAFSRVEAQAFPGLARGKTSFRQPPVEPDPEIVRQLRNPHQVTEVSPALGSTEIRALNADPLRTWNLRDLQLLYEVLKRPLDSPEWGSLESLGQRPNSFRMPAYGSGGAAVPIMDYR